MCYGLRASVFEEFLALGDFHKNGPSARFALLPSRASVKKIYRQTTRAALAVARSSTLAAFAHLAGAIAGRGVGRLAEA